MLLDINSFFYALGHAIESLLNNTLVPIAPYFNFIYITLGFFGLFYWLYRQGVYNREAREDKNQIK